MDEPEAGEEKTEPRGLWRVSELPLGTSARDLQQHLQAQAKDGYVEVQVVPTPTALLCVCRMLVALPVIPTVPQGPGKIAIPGPGLRIVQ